MATSKNALRLSCAFGLVALSVLLTQGGCGGTSISSICDQICDCETCTDAYRKSCEDEGGFARVKADNAKCTAQFEAHTTCLMDKITCQKGTIAGAACAAQGDALNVCTKDTVPFVAACELAADHLAGCGAGMSTPVPGTKSLCVGVLLCNATCINTASCEELVDAFSGAPTSAGLNFLDCTTKCKNGG